MLNPDQLGRIKIDKTKLVRGVCRIEIFSGISRFDECTAMTSVKVLGFINYIVASNVRILFVRNNI